MIRATSSGASGERPILPCLKVHFRLTSSRCHRRSVAGWTGNDLQRVRGNILAAAAKKILSMLRNLGRPAFLERTSADGVGRGSRRLGRDRRRRNGQAATDRGGSGTGSRRAPANATQPTTSRTTGVSDPFTHDDRVSVPDGLARGAGRSRRLSLCQRGRETGRPNAENNASPTNPVTRSTLLDRIDSTWIASAVSLSALRS